MKRTIIGILSLSLLLLGCGTASAESGTEGHRLLYQGHGSLRIVTSEGKVIYIDPYAGEGYDLPADLILITHGHQDHTAVKLIKKRAEDCRVITWKEALDNVIVAKTYAERWTTDKNWNPYYTDFTMSPERAHGLSMFIRQDPISYYYQRRNPELERFLWYYAVWERPTTE